MCLYPKLIKNRRYLPNKKNGGIPPVCPDERLLYVTAACGDCLECRQQRQRAWKVRMNEELRQNPNAYFLTLTISDENYVMLKNKYNLEDDNEIATKAIRLCLERARKETGKSVKHWFVTELGHNGTERIHLHGLVWGIGSDKKITNNWKYGITFTGTFVNERTVNYITKYILKVDVDHKNFRGKVLSSAGIGSGYTDRADAQNHKYKKGKTNERYRTRTGIQLNLPIYYRNKLFTEEEREKIFLDKIEKGIIYVMGQPVHRENEEYYIALLEEGRKTEQRLYGDRQQDWEQFQYINRLRRQMKKQDKDLQQLETHWALEQSKDYTQIDECPF